MQEKSTSTSNTNSNSVVDNNFGATKYVDKNGKGLIKGSKAHIYHTIYVLLFFFAIKPFTSYFIIVNS